MSVLSSLYILVVFVVLSPGIFFRLPKSGSKMMVAIVHSIIFAGLVYLPHTSLGSFIGVEGFLPNMPMTGTPCSPTAPTGFCPMNQTCVGGACQQYCTTSAPTGYCPSGKTCINGTCQAPCSVFSQTGFCPSGQICSAGACQAVCSTSAPTGYCPSGQGCERGMCLPNCSPSHEGGYCPIGTSCLGGTCKLACSGGKYGPCANGKKCTAVSSPIRASVTYTCV